LKNAIILAAGKSTRFAPFTYEKPKGLFNVRNEVLIERQICQLKEAGIKDIYIVVGYMKEKFFYLEEKYNVKLIINNNFSNKGNIYSLYSARNFLANSFICCADHYFLKNPFLTLNKENISWRHCTYLPGKFREFAVSVSDANVITDLYIGGQNQIAMVGCAYFNQNFSNQFTQLLEKEIDDFGVSNLFWEEFYARHQKELTLYSNNLPSNYVLEFDSIEDLKQFDADFLQNVDSQIISNICHILKCTPQSIVDITVIQAGLTNISFAFSVNQIKYVYRHPGATAGNLIDRQTEIFAQYKAKDLNIDKSVIYIDQSGWKISYFVKNLANPNFLAKPEQLNKAMEYLRTIHKTDISDNTKCKYFDTIKEAKKLMHIASASKGDLFYEFNELISKIEDLNKYIEIDAQYLGIKKVLCHNDTYEPNFLVTEENDLYLIDWEYAGINYPANDIGCILSRGEYTDDQVQTYLTTYFGRELTFHERRHYIAYIALSAFYWFCWGLYKGSVGDDDGFFFLPAYRNCMKYIDKALDSYKYDEVNK